MESNIIIQKISPAQDPVQTPSPAQDLLGVTPKLELILLRLDFF